MYLNLNPVLFIFSEETLLPSNSIIANSPNIIFRINEGILGSHKVFFKVLATYSLKSEMLKYSEVQILAGCALTTVMVYSSYLDNTGWIWCAFVVYDRYSEP